MNSIPPGVWNAIDYERLGYHFLDSGALYRVTGACSHHAAAELAISVARAFSMVATIPDTGLHCGVKPRPRQGIPRARHTGFADTSKEYS